MPSLQCPRRCLRYWLSVILTTVGVLVIYFFTHTRMNWVDHDDEFGNINRRMKNSASASVDPNVSTCAYLSGMDEVLVILKTGATEALDKIPVHLATTLRCVPHYVIFSDLEEDIAGVRTRDILRSVSKETKRTNPDFGIYNRLRTLGRDGLIVEDWIDDENGPFGKPGNPGWKLDKWKFVPMIDEALLVKPDAHWYVFIEGDSYVIWRNMVRWLSRFDSKQPHYLGAAMKLGDEIFAYGGAGIVLSNVAMRLVSQYRAKNFANVEKMTASNWAGDHVLGKILDEIAVPLIWSWPMLVPSSVWEFEYFIQSNGRNPWCYPAVSYHHMAPQDIQEMWLFEQWWFTSEKKPALLNKDVFYWHIYEVIRSKIDDWDNFSSDREPGPNNSDYPITLDECARKCALIIDCLQFSFSTHRGCLTSKRVIPGVHRPGSSSGWMATRIKALLTNAGRCTKIQYVPD